MFHLSSSSSVWDLSYKRACSRWFLPFGVLDGTFPCTHWQKRPCQASSQFSPWFLDSLLGLSFLFFGGEGEEDRERPLTSNGGAGPLPLDEDLVISGFFGSFDPYKTTVSNLHSSQHSYGHPVSVAKCSLTLPISVLEFQGLFSTWFLVKMLPVDLCDFSHLCWSHRCLWGHPGSSQTTLLLSPLPCLSTLLAF